MADLTVSHILSEMADVQTLIGNARMSEDVKANCVAQLASKIRSMPQCSTSDAVHLCQAISSLTMPDAFSTALQTAVDARLSSAVAAAPAMPKEQLKPQLLLSICEYLSEADWILIDNGTCSPMQIMQVIANRLSRLGVRSLHEQTVKWSVALVVWIMRKRSNELPSYGSIFEYVCTFKELYKQHKGPYPHRMLLNFPMTPDGLPDEVRNHAYDAEDGPISRSLPHFQSLGEQVPLRQNSALLARDRLLHHGLQMTPTRGKQAQAQAGAPQLVRAMMACLQNLLLAWVA